MNWKAWIPLVLAAALGLIAAKAGRDVLVRAQRSGVTTAPLTKIVVARADLEIGHALGETDLALSEVAADGVPRGSFFRLADLTGRVVIQPLVQRQPVLDSALAPQGVNTAAQALVPAGMRAITIQIDEVSGLAGLVSPGCHVDVVCSIQDDKASQVVAKTIVENVKVLAVGQRMSPTAKKEGEEQAHSKSATLLVWPRDAEAIELASSAGRPPRLVLRGVRDAEHVQTAGITAAELLGGSRRKPDPPIVPVAVQQPVAPPPVAPAPAKPASRFIEVIRNGAITRIEIPAAPDSGTSVTGTNGELAPATPGRSP